MTITQRVESTHPIYQLVYASSSTGLFSADDLNKLLGQSRTKNARLGITGILLYKEGNLMQLLEGEEEKVATLYNRISQDLRHRGAMILLKQNARRRLFGDWSMAYRQLSDGEAGELPGFNDLFDRPFHQEEWADGGKCLRLLGIFREKM